ncbi:MAG TPA: RNase H family protein, partial [Flavobacteriaceae bacterium]|nr:RNase H family protein [Flavobacteriaceae bacterium]
VDAASSGNPGIMEYRGVDTQTGQELFHQGPFEQGTNNVGEFLALVHGLAYLKKINSDRLIYSDSRIAMGWVKAKTCRTKLKQTYKNRKIFELIIRAEHWLKSNTYTTKIVKWETKAWGEIPADFGRK